MTINEIIDNLPPLVYIRRGELVMHFSTSADLVCRVQETATMLTQADRFSASESKPERAARGKPGTRSNAPSVMSAAEAEDGAQPASL